MFIKIPTPQIVTTIGLRRVAGLGIATLLWLGVSLALTAYVPVAADPAVQTNLTQLETYCKSKLPTAADTGCDSAKGGILDQAITTATWNPDCITASSNTNAKTDCILAKAKTYVADAASPAPGSAAAFKNALTGVLDHTISGFGSPASKTTAEPSATTGADATCTAAGGACSVEGTADPAACAVHPSIKGCGGDASAPCDVNSCDLVQKYLNPAIKGVTILFGLIAAISLIIGGIQYSSSAGDPQKASAAKDRISKTLIAFFAYAFFYAFLQFIVPGGAFK